MIFNNDVVFGTIKLIRPSFVDQLRLFTYFHNWFLVFTLHSWIFFYFLNISSVCNGEEFKSGTPCRTGRLCDRSCQRKASLQRVEAVRERTQLEHTSTISRAPL